jgi:hypothetical protein
MFPLAYTDKKVCRRDAQFFKITSPLKSTAICAGSVDDGSLPLCNGGYVKTN